MYLRLGRSSGHRASLREYSVSAIGEEFCVGLVVMERHYRMFVVLDVTTQISHIDVLEVGQMGSQLPGSGQVEFSRCMIRINIHKKQSKKTINLK